MFIRKGPVDDKSVLVQVMACRLSFGSKPSPETKLVYCSPDSMQLWMISNIIRHNWCFCSEPIFWGNIWFVNPLPFGNWFYFQCENVRILIQISINFVPKGPVDDKSETAHTLELVPKEKVIILNQSWSSSPKHLSPGPIFCLLLTESSNYAQPITIWSNLPCNWPSTAWAYFENDTESSPGARPTNGISIEFEIRSKFAVFWFKRNSTDHN